MSALKGKQARFVEEYLKDLNATQAAIRAGYSEKTAYRTGADNLRKPQIAAAIEKAMQARSERTEITSDMVLQRWWQIATADANELSQYRRTCCRNCFGEGHAYQWRDEEEYQRAASAASQNGATSPTDEGGYGYDPALKPHPKCPACDGEGVGAPFFADTRALSPSAAALYAGVKQTKDGVEIKTLDQGKALENVARHLGMFTDRHEITGPNGGPVEAVTRVELVAADGEGEA